MQLLDERVLRVARDEDVVGRRAHLAGVRDLAPEDAARGEREVGGLGVDHDGGLACGFLSERRARVAARWALTS